MDGALQMVARPELPGKDALPDYSPVYYAGKYPSQSVHYLQVTPGSRGEDYFLLRSVDQRGRAVAAVTYHVSTVWM